MSYFVMGTDPANSRVMFMRHTSFDDKAAANEYAKTCAAGFNAFVVGPDVRVHDYFMDTKQAYDETQWNEAIRNGDILVIKDEQVIGIADTWPVAVTKAFGSLHAVAPGADLLEYEELAKYRTAILMARKLADNLGWPT